MTLPSIEIQAYRAFPTHADRFSSHSRIPVARRKNVVSAIP